jgi:hypothetical protein
MLVEGVDCACDILNDFCVQNLQGVDFLVTMYGGATGQAVEIAPGPS